MKSYKILSRNTFSNGKYSIVPIREQDSLSIMNWRNEQIYHLRQNRLLSEADQRKYFRETVSRLFMEDSPSQILFSYLNEENTCIGYGGLVHINWYDRNAEISFIMATALEKDNFHTHWSNFLGLLEKVAFEELALHKIYTYAFDLRPHLYEAVEASGYRKEAVLKGHCCFDDSFVDVVIHAKFNNQFVIRRARVSDMDVVYSWSNDRSTRDNSFSVAFISFEDHVRWWNSKMDNPNAIYFIAEIMQQAAGIVRFDKDEKSEHFVIGINISPSFRGQGISSRILTAACRSFFNENDSTVDAYIRPSNIPSIKLFERAGFRFLEEAEINGNRALKYELTKHEK